VVHDILKLVKSKEIERGEVLYAGEFLPLVDKSNLLLNRIKAQLRKHICVQNKSECPDLFGSTFIDILECILDCKKDITVNTSGAMCYINGQYEVYGTLMDELPATVSGLEPLSVQQQMELHNTFHNLATWSNNFYMWKQWRYEDIDTDFDCGAPELDNVFQESDISYREYYADVCKGKARVIFKVDLKCRKELAPFELLAKLDKEQSYDYTEDKSAPGANTAQNSSPDLELKLQIVHWIPSLFIRDNVVREYLIQRGTQRANDPSGCTRKGRCSHAFV
jgi:hypothetical protein